MVAVLLGCRHNNKIISHQFHIGSSTHANTLLIKAATVSTNYFTDKITFLNKT